MSRSPASSASSRSKAAARAAELEAHNREPSTSPASSTATLVAIDSDGTTGVQSSDSTVAVQAASKEMLSASETPPFLVAVTAEPNNKKEGDHERRTLSTVNESCEENPLGDAIVAPASSSMHVTSGEQSASDTSASRCAHAAVEHQLNSSSVASSLLPSPSPSSLDAHHSSSLLTKGTKKEESLRSETAVSTILTFSEEEPSPSAPSIHTMASVNDSPVSATRATEHGVRQDRESNSTPLTVHPLLMQSSGAKGPAEEAASAVDDKEETALSSCCFHDENGVGTVHKGLKESAVRDVATRVSPSLCTASEEEEEHRTTTMPQPAVLSGTTANHAASSVPVELQGSSEPHQRRDEDAYTGTAAKTTDHDRAASLSDGGYAEGGDAVGAHHHEQVEGSTEAVVGSTTATALSEVVRLAVAPRKRRRAPLAGPARRPPLGGEQPQAQEQEGKEQLMTEQEEATQQPCASQTAGVPHTESEQERSDATSPNTSNIANEEAPSADGEGGANTKLVGGGAEQDSEGIASKAAATAAQEEEKDVALSEQQSPDSSTFLRPADEEAGKGDVVACNEEEEEEESGEQVSADTAMATKDRAVDGLQRARTDSGNTEALKEDAMEGEETAAPETPLSLSPPFSPASSLEAEQGTQVAAQLPSGGTSAPCEFGEEASATPSTAVGATRPLSASVTTAAADAPPVKAPRQEGSSTSARSPAAATASASPSPGPPLSATPQPPSSTRPVLNIAGVNVQALLMESSDPPPLYTRRQRRTRRKAILAEDHPIFAEHRDLWQHDHAHRIIARAPCAGDAEVLNSLVDWKDSPALVYARLLWRYTPQPFLHAAMYGLDAPAVVKPEKKTEDSAVAVKKEAEDE